MFAGRLIFSFLLLAYIADGFVATGFIATCRRRSHVSRGAKKHPPKKKPAFEVWYEEQEEKDWYGDEREASTEDKVNNNRGKSRKGEQGVRLNKCFKTKLSRREADRAIEEGRVRVNGKAAVAGTRVYTGDKVQLDRKEVNWEVLPGLKPSKQGMDDHIYIKYFKPAGVTCTTSASDPTNIIAATGVQRTYVGQRLFPVGRLDKDSTGIILMTNDGRLPGAMLSAKEKMEKNYLVCVDRGIPSSDLAKLAAGVVITTKVQGDRRDKEITSKTLPCRVERVETRGEWFRVSLIEGRNRQIRKMCEAIGYNVVELHREGFAGIQLNGLGPGQLRELNKKEIGMVRKALKASKGQGTNVKG
ncbi:unnamed protein product [Chrysoparadoxa australica]